MKISFHIWKDEDWFDKPVYFDMEQVPRIGEMVEAQNFFPKFLTDEWEMGHKVNPFLKITAVYWRMPDKIEITLENKY